MHPFMLQLHRSSVREPCFSSWSQERTRNGKALKVHFLDVRKAYFNGVPRRRIYVKLPKELGFGKTTVGLLEKCMYGTRDAGAIWEATYTAALLKIGFRQGVASPCCVHHDGLGIARVVHGDGFTAVGTYAALDV